MTASSTIDATGNITGGNLVTAGDVTTATVTASSTIDATGNITGGNITTAGISSLGNIIISGDDITGLNNVTFNAAGEDIDFTFGGDNSATVLHVDGGTDTVVIGSSTATVGASLKIATTDSILFPVGNTATRPGSPVVGMIRYNSSEDNLEAYTSEGWEAVGTPVFTTVTADSFTGNGVQTNFTLSENSTTAATIVSINGVVQIPTTAYAVSGNVLAFTEAPEATDVIDARLVTTTTTITGLASANGNSAITLNDDGTIDVLGDLLPTANVTYDLGAPSLRWNDLYLANSTIYLGNATISANATSITMTNPAGGTTVLSGSSPTIAVDEIIKTGSNGVGNIGSISSQFNTVFAKATSAQYADLAEMYAADADVAPGTVVMFGGSAEVTVCDTDACRRVAGVVSTNPSFLMNSACEGEYVVAVALTGRVPCDVVGPVRKGDLMVSAGAGRARAEADPRVGSVIGKALQDFDGETGTIEVVVGRF